jgi:hypothetical protein
MQQQEQQQEKNGLQDKVSLFMKSEQTDSLV